MFTDSDFQTSPFGTHVGGGDGSIGPNPPTVPYAPFLLPNNAFYSPIQSAPAPGAFPTAMTYWNRPVLNPSASKLVLDFDAYFDAAFFSPANANAFETDTMLVTAGATPAKNLRRNFSIQNVAGQLYVIQKGIWVPFAKPGTFTPGTRYHHTIGYSLAAAGGAYQYVTINGTVYVVPAALQTADVIADGWSVIAAMQLQQSLLPTGSGFAVSLDHLTYTWF